jgi:tetrahydromethanopterin S-methyltransferase subunit B
MGTVIPPVLGALGGSMYTLGTPSARQAICVNADATAYELVRIATHAELQSELASIDLAPVIALIDQLETDVDATTNALDVRISALESNVGGSFTTTTVTEGTNLYFTTARAQTAALALTNLAKTDAANVFRERQTIISARTPQIVGNYCTAAMTTTNVGAAAGLPSDEYDYQLLVVRDGMQSNALPVGYTDQSGAPGQHFTIEILIDIDAQILADPLMTRQPTDRLLLTRWSANSGGYRLVHEIPQNATFPYTFVDNGTVTPTGFYDTTPSFSFGHVPNTIYDPVSGQTSVQAGTYADLLRLGSLICSGYSVFSSGLAVSGFFAASGANLYNIPGTALTGTIPPARLSSFSISNVSDRVLSLPRTSGAATWTSSPLLLNLFLGGVGVTTAGSYFSLSDNTNALRAAGSVECAVLDPSPASFRTEVRITAAGSAGSAAVIRASAVGAATPALGFYNSPAIVKPVITGSRAGNAALASLLSQLSALGLITNDTTN